MKVHAALLADAGPWEELLRQEGLPFTRMPHPDAGLLEESSVLILARALAPVEKTAVAGFLRAGGAVLGAARYLEPLLEGSLHAERVEYIVGDGEEVFGGSHLIDLGERIEVPPGAGHLRTPSGSYAVRAGDLLDGHCVALPFDPGALMFDARAANKSFHFHTDRLPAERVSLVSKAEVRYLVHRSLEYLHHRRGLPYAHLWYYPSGDRNLFALRVDTDGASEDALEELYGLAGESALAMSWFLDVKSHEGRLRRFAAMSGQELALHCYEHRTHGTCEQNLAEIRKARHLLGGAGIRAEGFAAPYGEWNPGLGRALEEAGFAYSSEFGYAYDTLPLYPSAYGTSYGTLQVPIHPVCIGSLMAAGYGSRRMAEYFRTVFGRKLSRNEPLFFYHHPGHRHTEVLADLAMAAEEAGIRNTTFGAYAAWWGSRGAVSVTVRAEGSRVRSEGRGPATVALHVTAPGGTEAFLPLEGSASLEDGSVFSPAVRPEPAPSDIRRIRAFDPRTALADLYTRIGRRLR
ncbi:MAG: hypothetical protein WB626_00365 [Bacteroidota bacterium]